MAEWLRHCTWNLEAWGSIQAALVMYKNLGQALKPCHLWSTSSIMYQVERKMALCEWLQLQKIRCILPRKMRLKAWVPIPVGNRCKVRWTYRDIWTKIYTFTYLTTSFVHHPIFEVTHIPKQFLSPHFCVYRRPILFLLLFLLLLLLLLFLLPVWWGIVYLKDTRFIDYDALSLLKYCWGKRYCYHYSINISHCTSGCYFSKVSGLLFQHKYTRLRANLPPKCFSEMAPRTIMNNISLGGL